MVEVRAPASLETPYADTQPFPTLLWVSRGFEARRLRSSHLNHRGSRSVGGACFAASVTTPTPTRYWINTISLEHVLLGVEGGFTQADHGRDTRLRRLARGDAIAFYSSRRTIGATGRPLQQFTALGTIVDDEPYRFEMSPDFQPWRRRVEFEDVRAVPIRPLLPMLGFITDEQRWGLPFRSGLFEVTAGDFGVIAGALRDAATMDDAFSASGRRAEA